MVIVSVELGTMNQRHKNRIRPVNRVRGRLLSIQYLNIPTSGHIPIGVCSQTNSSMTDLPTISYIRHHPFYIAYCPIEAKTDMSTTPISLSTRPISYSLRQPINNHRVVPRYQNIKIIVGFCDYFFKPLPMWVRGLVRGGTLLRQGGAGGCEKEHQRIFALMVSTMYLTSSSVTYGPAGTYQP